MKENVIVNYIKECFAELATVTWPTKNQAVRLTGIVLVFCVIVAIVLTLVDYGFNTLYTYILTLSNK